jgi:hypothetical protein
MFFVRQDWRYMHNNMIDMNNKLNNNTRSHVLLNL